MQVEKFGSGLARAASTKSSACCSTPIPALKGTTDSAWAASEPLKEVKRWGGGLVDRAASSLFGGKATPEADLASYKALLPHTFDSPLAVGNLSTSYLQA